MGLRLWGPLFCPELPVFVLCTSTPLASYLCRPGGFLLGGRGVARGITPRSPTPWLSTPSLVLAQCQVCLRVSPDHKCNFPERSPPGPAGQGPLLTLIPGVRELSQEKGVGAGAKVTQGRLHQEGSKEVGGQRKAPAGAPLWMFVNQ